MYGFRLELEGDNAFPELKGKIQETEIYAFSALPGGMKSGKPSVSIISKIGEDKYGIIQVSLEAFLAVAGALKAKYTIDPNAN